MPELNHQFLRRLAEWGPNGAPVSSLYLDVDGKRYPRRQDVELRAEEQVRQLRDQARDLPRAAARSVSADGDRMLQYFRDLDRGSTRGVALFSCSERALWEEIRVPRPIKDRVAVAEHPYVLPLEVLVETYERFCTVLVDKEKARLFLAHLGTIEEQTDVFDDVPGRHEQGGWSQSRFQRHIDEHVGKHIKHVADELLRFFKRRGFDHLILAGPEEAVTELERHLHDYVRQRVVTKLSLPITASADEVLARSLEVEERLEEERERQTVERLRAEVAAGRQAVVGFSGVLQALNDGRVDTLVVPFGLSSGGLRCTDCGRLWAEGGRCRVCRGRLEPVPDVVESAVASALRQSAHVETITFAGPQSLDGEKIGALLRY
ncbi:MAG TPA: VLRF1 family aeRF1-type release factor [Actinomycetota bacterium]|nr:VLRF1 family aeRF1-type release factor [Actinomycetota bacterium]